MNKRNIRSKKRRTKKEMRKFTREQILKLRRRHGIVTLKEAKLMAIKKAVGCAKGDKLLAAALLDTGKSTVYRYVK